MARGCTPALRPLREKAAYVSFVLLLAGGLLLIADLSQPMRFLNILNPLYLNFTSPLAWGALNIVAFGIASVLYLLALRKDDESTGKLLAADHRRAGTGTADLHRLRPDGAPVASGVEHADHAGAVRCLAIASGSAVGLLLAGGNEAAQKVLREYMLWSAAAVAVMLVSIWARPTTAARRRN